MEIDVFQGGLDTCKNHGNEIEQMCRITRLILATYFCARIQKMPDQSFMAFFAGEHQHRLAILTEQQTMLPFRHENSSKHG